MTYLDELEGALIEKLKKLPYDEALDVVDFVKKAVVESFQNGLAAGRARALRTKGEKKETGKPKAEGTAER